MWRRSRARRFCWTGRGGGYRGGKRRSGCERSWRNEGNGQSLAYVYGRETKADADLAKVLTLDEARRIASNIAKLPTLLGKG